VDDCIPRGSGTHGVLCRPSYCISTARIPGQMTLSRELRIPTLRIPSPIFVPYIFLSCRVEIKEATRMVKDSHGWFQTYAFDARWLDRDQRSSPQADCRKLGLHEGDCPPSQQFLGKTYTVLGACLLVSSFGNFNWAKAWLVKRTKTGKRGCPCGTAQVPHR
jgi:hypothetical protein